MGKLNATMATVFGLGSTKGGSKLDKNSDNWSKLMNCVACGSYLEKTKSVPLAGVHINPATANKIVLSYLDQRT